MQSKWFDESIQHPFRMWLKITVGESSPAMWWMQNLKYTLVTFWVRSQFHYLSPNKNPDNRKKKITAQQDVPKMLASSFSFCGRQMLAKKRKLVLFSLDLAPRAVSFSVRLMRQSPKCWGLECISVALGLTSCNQNGLEWAEHIPHWGSGWGRGCGGGSIVHTQLNEQHQEQLNV